MSNKKTTTHSKMAEHKYSKKVFIAQNSILTNYLSNKIVARIYYAILALLLCSFSKSLLYDYIYNGEIKFGLTLIIGGFSKLHLCFVLWLLIISSTILIYLGFRLWATIRIRLRKNSSVQKLWDGLCLIILILYYPALIYLTTIAAVKYLTVLLKMSILTEMVRLIMKVHAFVRSNVRRVVEYKSNKQKLCPDIWMYLYFLFVPTFIYRDTYPKLPYIRWKAFFKNCLELIATIYFISMLLESSFIKAFMDFGLRKYTWLEIVTQTLLNGHCGFMNIASGFYIIKHIIPNGICELLKFSDRLFYKDWWTSTSFARYYKTWNIFVHEWLYIYVYTDLHDNVLPNYRLLCILMVYFVSALAHDYILWFAFGFFNPILFMVFFGATVGFFFLKLKPNRVPAILLLTTVGVGHGIVVSFYTIEYFARQNRPVENATLSSYVIPRSFSCNDFD